MRTAQKGSRRRANIAEISRPFGSVLLGLAYRHGLRASERCDLRWDHLNLDDSGLWNYFVSP
jgi:integrase